MLSDWASPFSSEVSNLVNSHPFVIHLIPNMGFQLLFLVTRWDHSLSHYLGTFNDHHCKKCGKVLGSYKSYVVLTSNGLWKTGDPIQQAKGQTNKCNNQTNNVVTVAVAIFLFEKM